MGVNPTLDALQKVTRHLPERTVIPASPEFKRSEDEQDLNFQISLRRSATVISKLAANFSSILSPASLFPFSSSET